MTKPITRIPLEEWINNFPEKDRPPYRTAAYWASIGKLPHAKKESDVVEVRVRRKIKKWFVPSDTIKPE